MKIPINSRRVKYSLILISLIFFQSCKNHKAVEADHFSPDIITSWNKRIMEKAINEDGLLTLKGVRTEAMMHVAMHDVLNSIQPIYASYAYTGKRVKADPIVAAAQAAYEIAISQFPNDKEEFEVELDTWLTNVNSSDRKSEGIRLGKKVSALILKSRFGDNWNGKAEYVWHPMAPGVYAEFKEHSATPEGFVFGAGWAAAQPFLLKSPDQFRSPPPPTINSAEYTNAFNEVKEYGKHQSELRTEDQSHLAMWWKDFVENSHNRLARKLVVQESLNLWESARVFALLNMTIYDAYVCVFNNKFHYNHWRPYTAIRWAAHDENPDTEPDLEWNNLHQHTYAFPSYPSAHGTASTAAMTVLANTLGTGDTYNFTMTTEYVDKSGPFSKKLKMHPSTRSFNRFSQAGMEASMSRVYLGIHFRYDSEEGFNLGTRIGQYANQHYLLPLKIRKNKRSQNTS